jgi:hypothetical protein
LNQKACPNLHKLSIENHEKFTREEISLAAENVLNNKFPDLNDSNFVSEVIEELISRQISLIVEHEYLKAHQIIAAQKI